MCNGLYPIVWLCVIDPSVSIFIRVLCFCTLVHVGPLDPTTIVGSTSLLPRNHEIGQVSASSRNRDVPKRLVAKKLQLGRFTRYLYHMISTLQRNSLKVCSFWNCYCLVGTAMALSLPASLSISLSLSLSLRKRRRTSKSCQVVS